MPFGAFVQVGDGIEGLVHISEMAAHHVEAPEQVVTPGEELWVKIIDIDLDRRRISLSIKQAAEGGGVAAEYQDQFGEHAYDEEGNYIGPDHRHSSTPSTVPRPTPVEGGCGDGGPVEGGRRRRSKVPRRRRPRRRQPRLVARGWPARYRACGGRPGTSAAGTETDGTEAP